MSHTCDCTAQCESLASPLPCRDTETPSEDPLRCGVAEPVRLAGSWVPAAVSKACSSPAARLDITRMEVRTDGSASVAGYGVRQLGAGRHRGTLGLARERRVLLSHVGRKNGTAFSATAAMGSEWGEASR